ncbi:hypothetical protein [Vibrio litoralis]|uniref:hypothetical protein n=1 Tax=Vibrio litoralis TaxID=335972 RepID=UPI001867DB9D|nr:hypothetical protein [Vibrio litoralis]
MFKYCLGILLSSLPFLSQACQITQSTIGNEYLVSEDCELPPYNSTNLDKVTPSTQYFVQYLFASSFQSYLNIKGEMQSKLDYPIAAQPYNYGYRMMIGPVSLENAQLALSELNRRGYRDALLKFYSKSKTSETISLSPSHESKSDENNDEESEQAETIVMPYMLPVFSIGGSTALLPIYDDTYQGKTTRYNKTYIGSFTFAQAQAVCRESNSKIASARDYNYMLSNMEFMMKYAVKSQFWLDPNRTVTRIQNQIATRNHAPSDYFNVICVTH